MKRAVNCATGKEERRVFIGLFLRLRADLIMSK